jgi:hypothetical protein
VPSSCTTGECTAGGSDNSPTTTVFIRPRSAAGSTLPPASSAESRRAASSAADPSRAAHDAHAAIATSTEVCSRASTATAAAPTERDRSGGEPVLHTRGVAGSIPAAPTRKRPGKRLLHKVSPELFLLVAGSCCADRGRLLRVSSGRSGGVAGPPELEQVVRCGVSAGIARLPGRYGRPPALPNSSHRQTSQR